MKLSKHILLIVWGLVLTLPLVAQRKPSVSRGGEQTSFYLEEPFKRPAKIPKAVLQLLRREIEKENFCPTENLDAESDLSSWFSASAVDLNDDRLPDLVVKSEKGCLNGVDNNWFWVVRNSGRGYRLVLFEGTLSVNLLKTKSHGFRDIQTDVATANTNYSNTYKFNGRRYKTRMCTEASPPEAKPKWVPCSEND